MSVGKDVSIGAEARKPDMIWVFGNPHFMPSPDYKWGDIKPDHDRSFNIEIC